MEGDADATDDHEATSDRPGSPSSADRLKSLHEEKVTMNVVTSPTRGHDDAPVPTPKRRTATFASMTAAMSTCAGAAAYAARPMH